MKKQKCLQKLSLNKCVIANLKPEQMKQLNAGVHPPDTLETNYSCDGGACDTTVGFSWYPYC